MGRNYPDQSPRHLSDHEARDAVFYRAWRVRDFHGLGEWHENVHNVGASAYATTKAAQVAFAKMMAVELGRQQVRVNVICPGSIDTEIDENTEDRAPDSLAPKVEFPEGQIPLTGKRPGTVHQVAQLALFLASDASSHITGTEIFIDGGQSLLQG